MFLERDDRNARSPSNVYDLIEYMKTEFGDVADHQVTKGENVGWYLDQRLISILVSDWIRQHGPGRVRLVARNTNIERSVNSYVDTDDG